MDEVGSLLEKMRRVFAGNEDKEKALEEIIVKVEEAYKKGALSKREMKMICNIFDYMEDEARDIMTHRKNIIAISGETTVEEAVCFMLEENYSRFPVYEEDIDNIVGLIHLRDAMKCFANEKLRKVPVSELGENIRPVSFVPETKSIDKLFQQMQKDKYHMVVVLDEYGQTEGIVTMEDIIEEIVGSIQDEYDDEEELITEQPDGSYIVDGMTQLEDLEELLGVDFDEEDYDTLNGYLVDCLDRIPGEDETCEVQFAGYGFHILSVDNNTIRKVHIEKKEN